MPSITIRLPKKDKDKFVETTQNRYLSVTAIFRRLIDKVNNDTDNTLDFLFIDNKKGR